MNPLIKKISRTINKKNEFFTFLRAQFSSQISSQFDFIVTIICVNIFGIFYGNATLIGNFMGGILNAIINYKWTFKIDRVSVKAVALKFLFVWAMSLLLNRQGTIFFTEIIMNWIPKESLPELVVENIFLAPKMLVSIVVGLGWNYNMQRYFVYKDINFRKWLAKLGFKIEEKNK